MSFRAVHVVVVAVAITFLFAASGVSSLSRIDVDVAREQGTDNQILLDVAGVLKSLRREAAAAQDALLPQSSNAEQPEQGIQILHRNSLRFRSGGKHSTAQSHQELLEERLRRDAARVDAIGQRLEMALNNLKQSDMIEPARNSNRSSKQSAGPAVTSGLSFGSGEYFVRMGVGTPSKPMYLVMDTGSDVPWIQCAPCKNCYKQFDSIYDPKRSSSFKRLGCSSQQCKLLDVKACSTTDNRCLYQVAYGDGSFTVGDLATESFSTGSSPSSSSSSQQQQQQSSVVFGCGHDNEGLFVGAAGLLGLGAGKLSFPSQLSSSVGGRKFSYCLVTRDNSVKASSPLLFGDSAIPSSAAFVFTQLLRNPRLDTFYYAGLSGISVGGTLLTIPSSTFKLSGTGRGGVIIDSGTSVTRLPAAAYTVMRDAFRSGTRKLPSASSFSLFDTCYDFSALSSVAIPTLMLHFDGGASLQLPPSNYMVPVDTSGTFCFAFAKTSLDLSIVGNIQQQTMRVGIDLDNSRIGFAPKQCS